MKAVASTGGLEDLKVLTLPLPEPGPGEVRVDVHASALNPADVKVLSGELAGNFLHGKAKPLVVGWDVVGVVSAVGSDADLPRRTPGGNSDRCSRPAALMSPRCPARDSCWGRH
jgi:NADPH:quinone reductase-like Zn-dependent oxidoreductase